MNWKIWIQIYLIKNILYKQFKNISTSLIYAQAVHETGNFTSNVFKQGNNLFGMQNNSRSWDGDDNGKVGAEGSADYSSQYKSIRDYFDRQLQFKIDLSSDQKYIQSTFDSGYATDPNYLNAWAVHFAKTPKPQKFIKYAGIAIVFFALLVWKVRKD